MYRNPVCHAASYNGLRPVPTKSLTVKHILVECVDLNDVRNKHFVASSIKDLLDTIEAHKIIDFIKETRFYKQL